MTIKSFRQIFTKNDDPLPLTDKDSIPYRYYEITLRKGMFGLTKKVRLSLKALGLTGRHQVVWRQVSENVAGNIVKVKELVTVRLVNEIPAKPKMEMDEASATAYISQCEIILGSSSKSRASILNLAKIPFTVQVADIDEKAIGSREPGANPNDLVLKVARAKAEALLATGKLPSHDNVYLVTCDQEAREFLKSYSKAPAETRGAMIVVNLKTGKTVEGVDEARQQFKLIPDEVIDKLIAQGTVYQCCGGFMIDDPLLRPYLDKREGDEDSIIGLSKRLLASLLKAASSGP
ncbi:hypothetical protein HDU67_003824 [Dinochytrium kinnereticum]|nr:hypothetical protein HDU67_003824 [Dinochytrium kinnereticum]